MMDALEVGRGTRRVAPAAGGVGLAVSGAIELALRYPRSAKTFGKADDEHQAQSPRVQARRHGRQHGGRGVA